DLARREEYVAGDGEVLQFAHEIVQAAIRGIRSSESAAYHDKLAECIRYLRPGDYRTRLMHSGLAGEHDRTEALAFALLLQEGRGEVDLSQFAPRTTIEGVGALASVLEAIRAAIKYMDHGEFSRAERTLVPL